MTYREKMINALESAPVHDGVIRMSEEVRDKIIELLKEPKEVKHHDQKTQAAAHQADHPVP